MNLFVYITASKRVVSHINDSALTFQLYTSNPVWYLNNVTYRIKITPIDRSLQTSVSVGANYFKDLNNYNLLSKATESSFTWSSDLNNPSLTISSPHVNDSQTITVQDVSINFSFDESLGSDLQLSDISYTNGEVD